MRKEGREEIERGGGEGIRWGDGRSKEGGEEEVRKEIGSEVGRSRASTIQTCIAVIIHVLFRHQATYTYCYRQNVQFLPFLGRRR